jgi:hypothetical protein
MSDANGAVGIVEHHTNPYPGNDTKNEANALGNTPGTIALTLPQPHNTPDMPRHTPQIVPVAGTRDWYLYVLATVVVVGFFVLTIMMITPHGPEIKIPSEHRDIAFMLFGGLVSGLSMVLSYFFGSSAGSAQKSAELAALARAIPQPSPKS